MINVRIPQKEVHALSPKITVIGVGGAGGNAVNNMIGSALQGCEFVVCNTDAQALDGSLSESKIQLGVTVTGGLGSGAKPEVGRAAAEESLDDVMQHLEGSNMAFITAGMGGGTGTGAAPVIARACREMGVLTVGVVTKPFHFEGAHRMSMAEAGIEEMQGYVDTLIVIPNQNLFRIANEKTTFAEAFKMADSVLQSGVRGVTDLMVMPGLINLDFADIRSAMLEMGKAMMGTGEAEGERRAVEASESAINNPLLDDVSMKGARGVIINVTGGSDMTLFEVDEACNRIRDEVDPNANIIFGSTFDEKLEGLMRVSVVATGIDAESQKTALRPRGGLVNSVTERQQQGRKLERALPNTEAAAVMKEKQAAPIVAPRAGSSVSTPASAPVSSAFSNVPAQGAVTASDMRAEAAIVAAKKFDEPESEMFEQKAFEVEPVRQSPQVTGSSLRGSVYKDSFIPPRPVEPEAARLEVDYAAGLGGASLAAKRPPQAEPHIQSTTRSGLTLRPPVPGGSGQKKKTPSLFERFKNPLKSYDHKEDEDRQGETKQGASGGGGALGVSSSPKETQGTLDVSVPKTENTVEDELDIPAFLRRQAN